MHVDQGVVRVIYSQVSFDDIGLAWGTSVDAVYSGGQRRLNADVSSSVVLFDVRVTRDSDGQLVSTVVYNDAGARETSTSPTAGEKEEEDALRDELSRLGLPTAFTSTKQPVRHPKKKNTKQSGWVQAFDDATGFYYYYNTDLGVSQWHVPKAGYHAMPGGHLLQEFSHMSHHDSTKTTTTAAELFSPPPCPSPSVDRTSLHSGRCTPRAETSGILEDGIPDVPTAATHTRFPSDDGAVVTKKGSRKNRMVQHGSNKVLQKYWMQRYSLFSLFDSGIIVDEEGWYSATPEIIAWHHATTIVRTHGTGCVVVDAFGGVGGNAIQLALAGCRVIAIEICPHRTEIIRNNARVYGVEHDIDILCGDFTHLGPCLSNVDVVLLSPPWGGPAYSKQTQFDVQDMGGSPELSFRRLLDISFGQMGCSSALFWLPRNSHREQLGIQVAACDSIPHMYRNECHIELATINNVDKAVTVYVGMCSQKK